MLKNIFSFLKGILKRYSASRAETWAASMSFHLMLGLPALCTVLLGIGRHFIGAQDLAILVQNFIPQNVYEGSLQSFLTASYAKTFGISVILSFLIAIFSASKIFTHLHLALGEIWHLPHIVLPKSERKPFLARVLDLVRARAKNALPLLVLAGLFIVLILVNTFFHLFLSPLSSFFSQASLLFPLFASAAFILTLGVVCGLFFSLFSQKHFTFRQWSRGGLITAVLIFLGQWALGFYFRIVDVGNGFGAFGSAVVLLVWLYYSTSTFLLGAATVCSIAPKK